MIIDPLYHIRVFSRGSLIILIIVCFSNVANMVTKDRDSLNVWLWNYLSCNILLERSLAVKGGGLLLNLSWNTINNYLNVLTSHGGRFKEIKLDSQKYLLQKNNNELEELKKVLIRWATY